MDKRTTKNELYDLLIEATRKAKELGSKEIFDAIQEVKVLVIRL